MIDLDFQLRNEDNSFIFQHQNDAQTLFLHFIRELVKFQALQISPLIIQDN